MSEQTKSYEVLGPYEDIRGANEWHVVQRDLGGHYVVASCPTLELANKFAAAPALLDRVAELEGEREAVETAAFERAAVIAKEYMDTIGPDHRAWSEHVANKIRTARLARSKAANAGKGQDDEEHS